MHSYNAKSGVATITGKEMKKLLYTGVRDVLCYMCSCREWKKNLNTNASRTGVGCHPQWRLISCLKGSAKPSINMVFHDTKHPHTVGIPSPRPCSSNHLTSPLSLSPPIVDDCKPGPSSVTLRPSDSPQSANELPEIALSCRS